jgi:hypothetical protein
MRRAALVLIAILAPGSAYADDATSAGAELARAEAAWKAACPDGAIDCHKRERVTSARHCGGAFWRVHNRRRSGDAARAQKALAAALERLDKLPESERPAAADARQRAQFLLAEPRLDALLVLIYPVGLRFDDKNKSRSMKAMQDFIRKVEHTGADARAAYRKVADDPTAPAELQLAGRARIAQLLERAAELFEQAAVPADLRTGEFATEATEAFCDAMDEHAAPIRAQAAQAYAACAALADSTAATGHWADVCRAGTARVPP